MTAKALPAADPVPPGRAPAHPALGPTPRYAAIARRIVEAVEAGRLLPGTVLTEEPLARAFGTSRTPVRTALADLLHAGRLERFDGRGFVVTGAAAPQRRPVTPETFALGGDAAVEPQPASARIAQDFETTLAHALPFGLWRINEQGAANHYDVSRTVVRELLSRFQDRGLVAKNARSHWIVGPLTSRGVAQYFAIRRQLEPLALIESGPRLESGVLAALHARAEAALATGDRLTPEAVEALETDLHVDLLSRSPNPHLLRMIGQTQIALTVNRVFGAVVGRRPFVVPLREHAIVYEFARRGAWDAAAEALGHHLDLSAERTRQRLKAISVFPTPKLPPYLQWQPH